MGKKDAGGGKADVRNGGMREPGVRGCWNPGHAGAQGIGVLELRGCWSPGQPPLPNFAPFRDTRPGCFSALHSRKALGFSPRGTVQPGAGASPAPWGCPLLKRLPSTAWPLWGRGEQ